jgi:hypothetical protein
MLAINVMVRDVMTVQPETKACRAASGFPTK